MVKAHELLAALDHYRRAGSDEKVAVPAGGCGSALMRPQDGVRDRAASIDGPQDQFRAPALSPEAGRPSTVATIDPAGEAESACTATVESNSSLGVSGVTSRLPLAGASP